MKPQRTEFKFSFKCLKDAEVFAGILVNSGIAYQRSLTSDANNLANGFAVCIAKEDLVRVTMALGQWQEAVKNVVDVVTSDLTRKNKILP